MRCAYCALQGLRNAEFSQRWRVRSAIGHYVSVRNEELKPFVWTANANDILQNVTRANSGLSSRQNEALSLVGRVTHENVCRGVQIVGYKISGVRLECDAPTETA